MNEIRAKEEEYNYVRVGAVSVVIPVLVQLGFAGSALQGRFDCKRRP